ncbi:MAG: tRNA-(ms[2]io[6]A)-hydroxylase [Cellvibrionales bacterium]|nr:tRNA-(ms[2]io[6]A)-hydroxylase [Cellvibrionales bacterium]
MRLYPDSPLLLETPAEWTLHVIRNLDDFLIDHAACEKKASGMAISLISHYPDRIKLVEAMADLAIEELAHYKEVIKVLHSRGLTLQADEKDTYINAFRKHVRNGKDNYFLDRLVLAGIVEARGAERFGLIAEALPAGQLKQMYKAITRSEVRHYALFIDLAKEYFSAETVEKRAHELLVVEADIINTLPIQAKLH